MNVSLASIGLAYRVVFGVEMEGNLPYSTAADQIVAAEPNWEKLMPICEEIVRDKDDDGSYLSFEEAARRATTLWSKVNV